MKKPHTCDRYLNMELMKQPKPIPRRDKRQPLTEYGARGGHNASKKKPAKSLMDP